MGGRRSGSAARRAGAKDGSQQLAGNLRPGNPLAPRFLAAMEALQDEARWREAAENVVTMFVSGRES